MSVFNHDKVGMAEDLFKVKNGDDSRPDTELDNVRVWENRPRNDWTRGMVC